MLRKDYIMRYFEDFGKVLAAILTLKKNQDWEKFEREISEASQKFTSLEIMQVEQFNDEDFIAKVINSESLTLEQKKILAILLFEKMNYYLSIEKSEDFMKLKRRCLNLYQDIRDNFTENEFDLDVHYKIEYLNTMHDEGSTSNN
jgi:hypothetical protein